MTDSSDPRNHPDFDIIERKRAAHLNHLANMARVAELNLRNRVLHVTHAQPEHLVDAKGVHYVRV